MHFGIGNINTASFMKLHKERSNGIKSGDTDGHENVPQRPIHMQGNAHQES